MAGLGVGGSKGTSKNKATTAQTQTNTLSDRAAGMLNQGISDVQGMQYQGFDPSQVSKYQSPYTQQVIDTSLAQADQTDAQARAQQQSDVAAAGAFGDRRRGIYEAELQGNQSRDRASLIAGLNDRAYTGAREIAVGENQNQNAYALQLQALLAQLRSGFANEGTQTMNGTQSSKGSNTNIGFTWAGK